MRYVALLRGINVGKGPRVEMKKLKALFEDLGHANVSTYINSGNVLFDSQAPRQGMQDQIEAAIQAGFGLGISTLIKSGPELIEIAGAIPDEWQNDSQQRTDVAFLFAKIDAKDILETLPINREYVEVRYSKGAIYWNFDRENAGKTRLNKLAGHKLYKSMTLRNVNTVRRLAADSK